MRRRGFIQGVAASMLARPFNVVRRSSQRPWWFSSVLRRTGLIAIADELIE
jgi:hypothetical protein